MMLLRRTRAAETGSLIPMLNDKRTPVSFHPCRKGVLAAKTGVKTAETGVKTAETGVLLASLFLLLAPTFSRGENQQGFF